MLILYIGAVGVHVALALPLTIFNVTPDEYSVTAIAAFLNDENWSSTVSQGGYYGYFQGLFYTPFFAIIKDPLARYKACLIVNGVLISFAVPISYYLSKRIGKVSDFNAVVFAIICGMYPSYVLLTKFTWNETIVGLLPWVFMLLVFLGLDAQSKPKKYIYSALGAFSLVAAYASHGRMLALVAAGIILVVVARLFMKRKIFNLPVFFSSFAVAFVIDKLLKRFFQNELWLVDETGKSLTNTLGKMYTRLDKLFTAEGFGKFVKTIIGHVYYFFGSTYGLGALAVIAIITALCVYFYRKKKKLPSAVSDEDAILGLFSALTIAAAVVVSSLFKFASTLMETRADTVIYGRYTEQFYPFALLALLILVMKGLVSVRQYFGGVVLAGVWSGIFTIFAMPIPLATTRMVLPMIYGLSAPRWDNNIRAVFTADSFFKISLTMVVVLLALMLVKVFTKLEETVFPIFACIAFIYSTSVCYMGYIYPQAANTLSGATNAYDEVSPIRDFFGDETPVVYSVGLAKANSTKLQFMMPELQIIHYKNSTLFKSASKENVDFIVAPRSEQLALRIPEAGRISGIRSSLQLYAYSDRAKAWAAAKGLSYVEESNGITYTADDLKENKDSLVDGNIIMPKGSLYSEYLTFYKNSYTMVVTGENLDNLRFVVNYDKNAASLSPFVVSNDGKTAVITFTAATTAKDAMIEFVNDGESNTVFNSAVIRLGSYTEATDDDDESGVDAA